MRYIISILIPFILLAKVVEIGDTLEMPTLISQYDKELRLDDGMWILTWDKESTHIANEYIKKHGMRESIFIVVDTSQVPSGIMKLFVKPKMQRYRHQILFSYDERYNRSLPYEEGSLSILVVEDGILKDIIFAKRSEDLEEFFK